MPRAHFVLPFLAFFAIAITWSAEAEAQVHRCTLPDGKELYADRRCSELGAAERLPRGNAPAPGNTGAGQARAYRSSGCARTIDDLMYEMTMAIDARDTNRLANVYHWPGLSSSDAYTVMGRLDVVAQRPLVDISPVLPSPAVPTANNVAEEDDHQGATDSQNLLDPELYPQAAVRQTPIALRVDQTLSNGSTPNRTVFGLTRHFGCWWVRFGTRQQ